MTPKTEAELADIIANADTPLSIHGGGTRPIGKPVQGNRLSVSGLSGIDLYDPGALTLVVQAGTPVATVEAALDKEGQRLAFEPMDHRGLLGTKGTPTMGGVVAANVSGPRRIQAGSCRDYLLGVRFVDGRGDIIKNGGRVMKNVTGYDLVKLMAGSYGTLGVMSQLSFKVLPKSEVTGTLLIRGLSDEKAVQALSAALGSPFDTTGAAHLPHDPDGPLTMIRLEGFESSVTYRAEQLSSLLAGIGACELEKGSDTSKRWTALRDVAPFQDREGDVWRLSVKPTDAPAIVAGLDGVQAIYDWGGGLVWLLCPVGFDLRKKVAPFGGHATLVRASMTTRATLPVFHPEPATLAALAANLRSQFDPKGLLNPGLMG
ncbi:MAG: FAD-binding protein [Paracoccaceae bacterium]|nr:FAD-binding protein [Paracoccaceae bacterium]